MRISSKHIAVTVVCAAILGAFGVGAFALAQSSASFNPQDFTSAYSKGIDNAERGYQANPIDTDAEANREKDDTDSNQKTEQAEQPSQDVFSSTPLQGTSGTTAYNVTGNAELANVGVANGNENSGNGGSKANTGNAGGAVIVKPGDNGSNSGNGDSSGDNSDSKDDPSPTPDPAPDPTPDPTPDPDPTPSGPNSYDVLPSDPGYDQKDTEKNGNDIFYKPVNGGNSSLSKVDPSQAHAVILPANTDDTALYTGQKLDAWMVFCSLSTFYVYNRESYAWTCSKDEFATYPYFRVDDFPKVVPNETFKITVSYRFNDADAWHTETIEYEPQQSCTFIVTGQVDDEGNPVVLTKSFDSTINLLRYTEQELDALGYREYGLVSNMILGWKEGDTEVGPFYTAEPGRHVIEPIGFAEVPSGLAVDTYFYFLNDKLQSDFIQGTHLSYLQRLYAIRDDSLGGTLVSNSFVLNVPLGVQAVEIDDLFGPQNVGRLVLPSSVLDVELSFTGLVVWDSFAVDADNPTYAATDDGILTSKDGTEYLGVPMNREKLDVPEGVAEVQLQFGNNLQQLVLHADDEGNLPYVSLETLNWCNILIDDEALADFVSDNTAALAEGNGNTISLASDPSVQYRTEYGKVFSDDVLKFVASTGSDLISVDGPHDIAEGCFEGNADVRTIVLSDEGDYTFEAGSLANSSVETIVCNSESQRVAVQAQLDAAGAADAVAVVSDESQEGYRYFTADKDDTAYTTLLSAPGDVTKFTGTFTAADGEVISPEAVAGQAFANNENLQWVVLSEDTSMIGANAFANCTNLQGVFISNPDTVTLCSEAFDGCYNLRFIGSRAMYGNFDFDGAPSYNCQLFRPTGSDGSNGYIYNFQYFTPDSHVTDYSLVQLDDGGYVLYGANETDGDWLAIASGSTITGEATLPSTTSEFYVGAFMDVQGDFIVNWRDLKSLMYVDGSAFSGSTVSGEVYIGTSEIDHVSIASDAFSDCPNITSLASDAPMFDCASWAFSNCENLTSVRLTVSYSYDLGFTLQSGIFYGCKSLETIQIDSWNPSTLTRYGKDFGFRFDGSSDVDDSERIRLIVPEGSEEYYLKDWLYGWLGYDDYDQYYSETYQSLYTETGVEPTRVQVKEAMSQGLLDTENQLRRMMGMEQVERSSFITIDDEDGYVFQTSEGTTTLISAPADAKIVDLDAVIGDKYDSVVLGANAFAECAELEQVIFGGKVSAIEPDAFARRDGVVATFPEGCDTMLLGASRTNPFRFGADIKLDIPEDSQTDYLATWPMQCVGILDDFGLGDYFFDVWIELWDLYPDEGPNAEQLNLAVNTPFMEQENYLRGLMGLEPIDDITKLESYIDASGMVDLRQDAQREPVVAAISTLSAHHNSVVEALQAAGLIASKAGEGHAVESHKTTKSDAVVTSPVADKSDAQDAEIEETTLGQNEKTAFIDNNEKSLVDDAIAASSETVVEDQRLTS